MTTIIILIILLVILLVYNFNKDREKYVTQNLDKQGGMATKYGFIITKLLKDPSTSIVYQDRDRIVLEKRTRFAKEEFIFTEAFGELIINWKSDLGRYGTEKKKWTFNSNTNQIIILKSIRDYMISLISEEDEEIVPALPKKTSPNDNFGLSSSNPIYVNGIKGELSYLSSLRNEFTEQLFFHRLGSFQSKGHENALDVFEIVSVKNEIWGILYFNMYSSINATKTPNGFYLEKDFTRPILEKELLGATCYLENFPITISMVLNNEHKDHPINLNEKASQFLSGKSFIRDSKHILNLLETECVNMFFKKLTRNCSIYPMNSFIQLLSTDKIKGQIFALMCLQRRDLGDGNLELYKQMSAVCLKMKDLGIINETIKVIEKLEPSIHDYWQCLKEIITIPSYELAITILSAPIDKETQILSTPYMLLAASEKNIDPRLRVYFLNLINKNSIL